MDPENDLDRRDDISIHQDEKEDLLSVDNYVNHAECLDAVAHVPVATDCTLPMENDECFNPTDGISSTQEAENLSAQACLGYGDSEAEAPPADLHDNQAFRVMCEGSVDLEVLVLRQEFSDPNRGCQLPDAPPERDASINAQEIEKQSRNYQREGKASWLLPYAGFGVVETRVDEKVLRDGNMPSIPFKEVIFTWSFYGFMRFLDKEKERRYIEDLQKRFRKTTIALAITVLVLAVVVSFNSYSQHQGGWVNAKSLFWLWVSFGLSGTAALLIIIVQLLCGPMAGHVSIVLGAFIINASTYLVFHLTFIEFQILDPESLTALNERFPDYTTIACIFVYYAFWPQPLRLSFPLGLSVYFASVLAVLVRRPSLFLRDGYTTISLVYLTANVTGILAACSREHLNRRTFAYKELAEAARHAFARPSSYSSHSSSRDGDHIPPIVIRVTTPTQSPEPSHVWPSQHDHAVTSTTMASDGVHLPYELHHAHDLDAFSLDEPLPYSHFDLGHAGAIAPSLPPHHRAEAAVPMAPHEPHDLPQDNHWYSRTGCKDALVRVVDVDVSVERLALSRLRYRRMERPRSFRSRLSLWRHWALLSFYRRDEERRYLAEVHIGSSLIFILLLLRLMFFHTLSALVAHRLDVLDPALTSRVSILIPAITILSISVALLCRHRSPRWFQANVYFACMSIALLYILLLLLTPNDREKMFTRVDTLLKAQIVNVLLVASEITVVRFVTFASIGVSITLAYLAIVGFSYGYYFLVFLIMASFASAVRTRATELQLRYHHLLCHTCSFIIQTQSASITPYSTLSPTNRSRSHLNKSLSTPDTCPIQSRNCQMHVASLSP